MPSSTNAAICGGLVVLRNLINKVAEGIALKLVRLDRIWRKGQINVAERV